MKRCPAPLLASSPAPRGLVAVCCCPNMPEKKQTNKIKHRFPSQRFDLRWKMSELLARSNARAKCSAFFFFFFFYLVQSFRLQSCSKQASVRRASSPARDYDICTWASRVCPGSATVFSLPQACNRGFLSYKESCRDPLPSTLSTVTPVLLSTSVGLLGAPRFFRWSHTV